MFARAQPSLAPNDEPPLQGKRVIQEKERLATGTWIRLEQVPCGNPRCRKVPDLHGPYWYSYALKDGQWRATYHGREPSKRFHARDLNRLRSAIATRSTTPADIALIRLAELTLPLGLIHGDDHLGALPEITELVIDNAERERSDRREHARVRHAALSTRSDELTASETSELIALADFLRHGL